MNLSSLDQAIRRTLVFGLVHAAGMVRRVLLRSEGAYRLLFLPGLEGFRWRFGKWRALRAFERARKGVPAYREFLAEHGDPRAPMRGLDPELTAIPVTTKENYVKRYSLEARCCGGKIPERGVVIDESSGTSGKPNNWVRGPEELAEVKQALQIALHHQLGRDPIFVLNAFALGPWATGMNVSMSVVDIAILKSLGPDLAKIENTLNLFGPGYRYLITGYPPFLKTLVDTADVEWERYDVTAVYGGEGMSEGMRDYLGRAFRKIYGSYGASDLEINIAAENDFTIALRRLLGEHEELRRRVVQIEDSGLPMIFQYNPLDYYIESGDEGELIVTLCRPRNAAPKIRYNIHDLGHVVRFPELRKAMGEAGVPLKSLAPRYADLPLLFLYGRADSAVPYFGCKITPTNIEDVVFSFSELADRVNSFALLLSEDEQATKRLAIAFELRAGADAPADLESLRDRVLARLAELNQDYREASRFMPPESVPTLGFHRPGEGPFAGHDIRLKRAYVQRS
jgi:phenylacetate-coenzyme A ligase PaaK-like adenylate-forming protein